MDFLVLLKWFLIGFVAVNLLKFLQIKRFLNKLRKKPNPQTQTRANQLHAAYKKSTLYFPLYYLLVWLTCSTFLFLEIKPEKIVLTGLFIGLGWWALSLLIEMIIWVVSNHRFKLSWKEMYVDTQPWVSLSYYSIIISPIILAVIFQ